MNWLIIDLFTSGKGSYLVATGILVAPDTICEAPVQSKYTWCFPHSSALSSSDMLCSSSVTLTHLHDRIHFRRVEEQAMQEWHGVHHSCVCYHACKHETRARSR